MKLTDLVAKLKELDESVEPSPWEHGKGYVDYQAEEPDPDVSHDGRQPILLGADPDLGRFITEVRNLLPLLIQLAEGLECVSEER